MGLATHVFATSILQTVIMGMLEVGKRANADNLQPWIVEVVVSVTTLSLVAVGLRLWSRKLKQQALWWDDWMILFSMIWNLAVVGFIFAMYSCGMGIHADKIPMDDIVMMAKWLVVAEVLYAWNLCWTKIGVLLMYYRVFRFPFFKYMAWGVGGFVIAWGITITFLFIFICVPVQKLWYPQLPGHCIDQVSTWIANAASTILTDVIILLIPMRELWKLQLRKFEKIALTLTFSLGFFVVFASAYRFRVLFTYSSQDPTYTLAPTVGWTSIEMSAGLISACLPVLRPVVQLCFRAIGLNSLHIRSRSRAGMPDSKITGDSKTPTTDIVELDERSSSSRNKDTHDSWLEDHDDENLVQPAIGHLRPDHGFEYSTTSTHSPTNFSRIDPRPLRGIQVRTEFSHFSNRASPSPL